MEELPDKSVDLVLCDLPYGVTGFRWDSVIDTKALWASYKRLCRGCVVLAAQQPFSSVLVMSNLREYRCQWHWIKTGSPTNFANVKTMPLRRVEDFLVFRAKDAQAVYNPQMEKGKPARPGASSRSSRVRWEPFVSVGEKTEKNACFSPMGKRALDYVYKNVEGQYYPTTLLPFATSRRVQHPTEKPVGLLSYLIRTYTHPGMVVMDNCMGSGSCGEAAMLEGRHFVGIERDEKYFDGAARRLLELTL